MTCHISNETPFPRWERTTSCLHSTNVRYDVSKHMQKKLSIYFSFLISPLNCNRNNALNISHVRCLDMFKIQDNKSFDFSINNNFGASLTFTLILRQIQMMIQLQIVALKDKRSHCCWISFILSYLIHSDETISNWILLQNFIGIFSVKALIISHTNGCYVHPFDTNFDLSALILVLLLNFWI